MKNIKALIVNTFRYYKTFWIFYSLTLIGFFMFISYIYILFIRERLPKDIPFELTEFRFYILVYICAIYMYIIKTLIYPKEPLYFMKKIIMIISQPLYIFYKYITYKFNTYHNKLKDYTLLSIDTWSFKFNIIVVYCLQIFPRLLLLLIFVVDIFYVKKIEVFYYFIFLSILPLLNHLLVFYLQNILLETIKYLEKFVGKVAVYEDYNYEHNPNAIHHNTTVTVQKYIEIQLEAYWAYGDHGEYIEYCGEPFPTEIYLEDYLKKQGKTIEELTADDLDCFKVVLDNYISEILITKIFSNVNDKVLKSAYIPQIKLFIAFTFLCCWLYILFVSLHTLQNLNISLMILNILEEYSKIPDQFSDISILNICIYTTNYEKKLSEKHNTISTNNHENHTHI